MMNKKTNSIQSRRGTTLLTPSTTLRVNSGFNLRTITTLLSALLLATTGFAQEAPIHKLSLDQAIELGLKNHQQLKIAEARLNASEQAVRVAKSQQLPSITLSANAFYLSDATLFGGDLEQKITQEMPHFGNHYNLQASQLLYKGGVIRKAIDITKLQHQLAELDLVANEQDIKFLIISSYLDISKLLNQIEVLKKNKELVEQLLENITNLYKQEMITKNEVLRMELQVKNLDQNILTLENAHAILSNQLSYALGLPDNVLIIPTDDLGVEINLQAGSYYTQQALDLHPALQAAGKHVEIAEKGVEISKTEWFPAIAAFAGYGMQRPVTGAMILDAYNNTWQAGISLSFNLDGLYKNQRKISQSKSQVNIAQEALTYAQQQIQIGVNAAFLKYREAEQQIVIMDESRNLANENYEIVRNKYLNQLAIAAEMTDASTAKLNAELQYINAVLNATFQYYSLRKASGTL